jgi:hypothetical protein
MNLLSLKYTNVYKFNTERNNIAKISQQLNEITKIL